MFFISVHVVHPQSRIDTTAACKNNYFFLAGMSDFHMNNNLLIAIYVFAIYVLISFSVEETLLPRLVNFFTNF